MCLQFIVIYFPHSNKDKFYKPSHHDQRGKKILKNDVSDKHRVVTK